MTLFWEEKIPSQTTKQRAVSGGVAVHYPPLSEIMGGVPPPWIFTKSLFRRLLTWNKSSMTNDRLLVVVGDAPKNNSVLYAFISSGPRKLNYRRLEGFFFYFQPSYGLLLFLKLKMKVYYKKEQV